MNNADCTSAHEGVFPTWIELEDEEGFPSGWFWLAHAETERERDFILVAAQARMQELLEARDAVFVATDVAAAVDAEESLRDAVVAEGRRRSR